ncbi:MAG: c-type cytochrome [Planctomycetaceae bacterium]|nr:c-type cytochrome [Planctomycetaceae bacterium]
MFSIASRSRLLPILTAGMLLIPAIRLSAQENGKNRDVFKEDLAGNEDVARIIKTFPGRGEVGDDSDPTPATESVKQFRMADGLKIELVASEPDVMQPLSMSFDARGRLWVVQYLQYPFPEGLKVIRYDQHLRAVFDKVPNPPPNHVKGKDLITVFEDTDGDGQYDSRKDVITGLNIATSVITGHGGIWVLNPPYLLFYPDANLDDVPDGPPEVRLSGFGLEDTHSVANSLIWGPDGWIYGANGSTTTGNVSSNRTRNIRFEGQCIWRYHPDRDVFEIYAEGGGNTFSSEIDIKGRVFSGTNHGNTRGMFYPQGSYATKSWGKHGPLTNPYAFGFFQHMRHEGDTDRFAQTFVIYEGGTLPVEYHGNVIAANALHNRVWASDVLTDGSTYRTVDKPNVCETDDRWFRPVDVKVGPDGAVYLADWYDTRLTHVDPRDNWHKTSGRIYRIQNEQAGPYEPVDLNKLSDAELIERFTHRNKWHRQTAVRVLGERLSAEASEATVSQLQKLVQQSQDGALESLWTLHLSGHFDDALGRNLLTHEDENLRRWSVRLLGDWRSVSDETGQALAKLAETEPYIQVRSQLASSAKRFPTSVALPILNGLLSHTEDQSDPHLPMMIWWAYEAHCGNSPAQRTHHIGVDLDSPDQVAPRQQLLASLERPEMWENPIFRETVVPRLMKRFAMEGDEPVEDGQFSPLTTCQKLLELAPTADHRKVLMDGFLEAYQGREIAALPEGLRNAIQDYQKSIGNSDLVLGVKLGQQEAISKGLAAIRDPKTDAATRLALISTFGQIERPDAVSVLLGLLGSGSSAEKKAAMESLMTYDDPKIGQTICSRYQSSLPEEHGIRATAQRVLASRPVWTKQFLTEITEFRIKPTTVSLDIVQQMRLHSDVEIQATLDKLWGKTRATPEEKQQEIARIRTLLGNIRQQDAETIDLQAGHELFKKHCAVCHTLFNEGGQTGPNLTGYERTNLEFLLLAIVDPSAGIREEFTQFQVATVDGRVLTGLLENQTQTTVTLRGANNQTTVINRDDVEILQAMSNSIMPDGLTQKLKDPELVNLFAYLMQRTPAAISSGEE